MATKIKKEDRLIAIYKTKCGFCKKEFESQHEGQLIHNVKVHEINCEENPENVKPESKSN